MPDDESVIFAIKCGMYREVLGTTVTFFLGVGAENGTLSKTIIELQRLAHIIYPQLKIVFLLQTQ